MAETAITTERRTNYSDDERAEALAVLASNGGNLLRTSNETGIPRQTLRQWRDGSLSATKQRALAIRLPKALLTQSEKYKRLCSKATTVAYRKVGALDAYRATLVAAVCTDKAQLLDGLPTHIHGNADHPTLGRFTPDQLRAAREALEELGEIVTVENTAGDRVEPGGNVEKPVFALPCEAGVPGGTGVCLCVPCEAGLAAGEPDRAQPGAELVQRQPERGGDPPRRVESGLTAPGPQRVETLTPQPGPDGQRVEADPVLGAERVQECPERE